MCKYSIGAARGKMASALRTPSRTIVQNAQRWQSNRPQPDLLASCQILQNPLQVKAGHCGCAARLPARSRKYGLSGWRDHNPAFLHTLAPHGSICLKCLRRSVTGARCVQNPRCCHSLIAQPHPPAAPSTSLAYQRHRHCISPSSRSDSHSQPARFGHGRSP